MSKEAIQESEYDFPYHHIPSFGSGFALHRALFWGHEYASYIEAILDELVRLAPASVLDIGCGDGRLLKEVGLRLPDARLHGTDFSNRAIAYAKAFAPAIRFDTVTLAEIAESGTTYDSFVLMEVFEHIPPAEASIFLKEVASVLSPGAHGIVTVPSTIEPLNPKHYRHFTEETLTEAVSLEFEVVSIRRLNADSLVARITQRIFSNRLFVLNYRPLMNALYRNYKRSCLYAGPNGKRLMAVVRRKG